MLDVRVFTCVLAYYDDCAVTRPYFEMRKKSHSKIRANSHSLIVQTNVGINHLKINFEFFGLKNIYVHRNKLIYYSKLFFFRNTRLCGGGLATDKLNARKPYDKDISHIVKIHNHSYCVSTY